MADGTAEPDTASPPHTTVQEKPSGDPDVDKIQKFLKQREKDGQPCATGMAIIGANGTPECRPDPNVISQAQWQQVSVLSGIATQTGLTQPTLYVFFDPNCPVCGDLWHSQIAGKSFHDIPAVWIPVTYYSTDSLGKAAAILRQGNLEALVRNFGANDNAKNKPGEMTPIIPSSAEKRSLAESTAV